MRDGSVVINVLKSHLNELRRLRIADVLSPVSTTRVDGLS